MSLEEKLKDETKSLKFQFIEKMKEWADYDFGLYEKMLDWNEAQWARYLGVKTKVETVTKRYRDENGEIHYDNVEKETFFDGFYNSSAYAKMDRDKNTARRIVNKGKDSYIEKKGKDAETYYENSILKLAQRLRKKGVDDNKDIQMETSHIGVNIETVITDGNIKVSAWTIIAEGPIQRPHYRYLVK